MLPYFVVLTSGLISRQLQQSHFSYPNTAYDTTRPSTSNYNQGFPPLSIPSSHYSLPPSTSASSASQYPLLSNNYRRPSYDQPLGGGGGGQGSTGNGQGGYGERPYSFDRERGDLDRVGLPKRERDDSPSSSSNQNQNNHQNPASSSNSTPNSRPSLSTYPAQPPYLYPFSQQTSTNPYLVNPQNIINTTIAGGSTSGNVAPLSEESHSGREDELVGEVMKKSVKRARGGDHGADGGEGGAKRDPLKRYVSFVVLS